MCKKINPGFDNFHVQTIFLNQFYVSTRYPDAPLGIAPNGKTNKYLADKAINYAKEITEFCKELIHAPKLDKLHGITQAPDIKDVSKNTSDYKTLFNAYAKEVLAVAGQKWTDKTNQLIAEKMIKNEITLQRIKNALKHSPEPIDKLNSFVSKIENQPEIKAILKKPREMGR